MASFKEYPKAISFMPDQIIAVAHIGHGSWVAIRIHPDRSLPNLAEADRMTVISAWAVESPSVLSVSCALAISALFFAITAPKPQFPSHNDIMASSTAMAINVSNSITFFIGNPVKRNCRP
jgi:hypothetical protein